MRPITSDQRAARAIVSAAASRSSRGDSTDGGTFISERTVRTSPTRRTSQSSSARAAAASGTAAGSGHGARIRLDRVAEAELAPQRRRDERHRRVQQAQQHAQHMGGRGAQLRVGSAKDGLASSRNQSQNTFQVKR